MRSEIEWVDEWTDLPSLTEFKGDDNFENIGSVILESMDLVFDWYRYPSIIIQWNLLRWWLLQIHLYHSVFKYAFSHFLIIRCHWFRELHQFWETRTISYKYRSKKPNRIHFNTVGCGRTLDWSFRYYWGIRVFTEQIQVTKDSGDWEWNILVGKQTWIEHPDFSSDPIYWLVLFQVCSIILIDWFDWWIDLNSQIFLNYNQLDLVKMHSIMFNRLCLRVIEWMDWWFRFA